MKAATKMRPPKISRKCHKMQFIGPPCSEKSIWKIFHFDLAQPKTLEILLQQKISSTNSSMTITLIKLFATPLRTLAPKVTTTLRENIPKLLSGIATIPV